VLAWSIAGVSALAAVVAAFLDLSRQVEDLPVYRLAISPSPDVIVEAGQAPQISRDGRRVAFVGSDSTGTSHIYVQLLDGAAARPLASTSGATQPFWAPDSRRLGFFAEGKLKTIAVDGGVPRTLADAPVPRGGTWNDDDLILFTPSPPSGVLSVSADGGSATPVPMSEPSLPATGRDQRWFPSFLPDGHRYLYLDVELPERGPKGISVATLDSTETRQLTSGGSSALYSAGYLLVRRESTLTATPFDPGHMEFTGPAVNVSLGRLGPGPRRRSRAIALRGVARRRRQRSPLARRALDGLHVE
jgi:hypothetical protein